MTESTSNIIVIQYLIHYNDQINLEKDLIHPVLHLPLAYPEILDSTGQCHCCDVTMFDRPGTDDVEQRLFSSGG